MAMKGVNLRVGATNHTGSALTGVTKGLKGVRTAQNGVRRSNAGFMKGMSANRRIIQGVGFQLSDLSVQIAGGQSAILALTQNVPQVVQMFGAWGAMLAALITIIGTLTLVMVKSGKGFADLAPLVGITRDEFAKIGAVVTKIKDVMIDFANSVINNLDVILISATLLGTYMGGIFVAKLIAANGVLGLFTKSLIFMRKALIATGFGALIVAAGYLIERLLTLNKATGDWGETFKLVGDLIKQVLSSIPLWFTILSLQFEKMSVGIKASWSETLSSISAGMPNWVNSFIGFIVGLKDATVVIFKGIGSSIQNAFDVALQEVWLAMNKMINDVNRLPGVSIDFIEPNVDRIARIAKHKSQKIGEDVKSAFIDATKGTYVGAGGSLTQKFQEESKLWSKGVAIIDAQLSTLKGKAANAVPAWQKIKDLLASVEGPKIDIRNFKGLGKADKETKKLFESLKENVMAAKKATGVLSATIADTNIDFSIDRIATSISKLSGIPAPKMDHILGEVDRVRERVKSLSNPMQIEIDKLNAILASDLKTINPTEFFKSTTEIATRIQEMSTPIKAELEKINALHPKLEGVDISFFTGSLDTAVNKVRTTMDSVRETVGEIHNIPPIKLPKIDTKPVKTEISKMMQFIEDLGETIGNSVKSNIKGLISGTTSLRDALSNVLDQIASKITDFAIDSLFANLFSGGGAGGGLGGFFTQALGSILSFNGGGFTGTGSRSGGIDGKGGFAAVLHPNETVIDHTKVRKNRDMGKQYDSGGSGASIMMNNNNYFNGVTREEVMADVDRSQKDMEKRMNAELPGKISKNRFNTNRGMAPR